MANLPERRLGHRLVPGDFKAGWPINEPDALMSPRPRGGMGAWGEAVKVAILSISGRAGRRCQRKAGWSSRRTFSCDIASPVSHRLRVGVGWLPSAGYGSVGTGQDR